MNVKLTSSVHTTHEMDPPWLGRDWLRWRESGSAARRGAATSLLRRADRGVSQPQ